MEITQAVLLVGGRGSRLGALSANTPKPLQEIAPGVRFLDLLLDHAARHGFADIVLLAGHLGEQVEAVYNGRRVREATIRVVREPSPMGTGGAFKQAAGLLAPYFLAANGDSFFDFNLRALTERPLGDGLARLALRPVADASRYGSVKLEDGRITAFLEKAQTAAAPSLINGGVYLLNRGLIDGLEAPCSLETDVFPSTAAQGLLQGRVFAGYFLDIGLPETLAQARREAASLFVRPAAVFDLGSLLASAEPPDGVAWANGARQAIRLLNDQGYYVLVTARQPPPAISDLQAGLACDGAHIDAFYAGGEALARALAEWPVEAARSFMVSARDSDLEAARRAGLAGRLASGEGLYARVKRTVGEPVGAMSV